MLTQPSANLYERIINKINREEKMRLVKNRLILQFFGLFISFVIFAPLALKLYLDVAKSGIMQFVYLLFTDFSAIVADIGDYVLTLLESAPMLSLALTAVAMLAVIFCWAKLEDAYFDFKKLTKLTLNL